MNRSRNMNTNNLREKRREFTAEINFNKEHCSKAIPPVM
jgi:hypothetical protein